VSEAEAGTGVGAAAVAEGVEPAGTAAAPARRLRHWVVFFGLAAGVVVADQVSKQLVVGSVAPGEAVDVIGEWLRIWYVANNGALFGMFRDQAILFAALSVAVMALIVWYHGRALAGSGWLATVALGLLLGGAIGNFIDRIRLGYVVDFVDMGFPGGWRFYTWNVADSAITVSILLLLLMAVLPRGGAAADAR
jgi:signal peptidase II